MIIFLLLLLAEPNSEEPKNQIEIKPVLTTGLFSAKYRECSSEFGSEDTLTAYYKAVNKCLSNDNEIVKAIQFCGDKYNDDRAKLRKCMGVEEEFVGLAKGVFNKRIKICTEKYPDRSEAISRCIDDDELITYAHNRCREKYGDSNSLEIKNCMGIVDVFNMPLDELESDILNRHPHDYYILSSRLFSSNKKDKAVFWFYAGKLRWGIRLKCRTFKPGEEGALAGALQYSIAAPINEYIGENPSKWISIIHKVLDWDIKTPNGFEGKDDCKTEIAQQRKDFLAFTNNLDENNDKSLNNRGESALPVLNKNKARESDLHSL